MFRRLSIVTIIISCFLSDSAALNRSYPEDRVSWTKGIIVSYGMERFPVKETGLPEDSIDGSVTSLNRGRIEAYRRAREQAISGIARMLGGIRIDPDTLFDDLLERSDAVQSRIVNLIARRVKLSEFPVDFYTSGCRAELKIGDLLQAVPYKYPAKSFPTRIDNPIPTEYTSLIIDTRGLGIEPMILPSVFDEDGLEVYGRYYVDIRHAMRYGIVCYVYTDDDAVKSPVAGDRPYYAVAVSRLKGCPVISDRDVRKIFSSSRTIAQLKKTRVVFIIDKAAK